MSYTHLTSQERHVIYHLILYGLSFREIGRRLGRSHSTIQREVQRNQIPNIKSIYTSERGTHRYRTFKHRAQHQRRKAHPPLWQYVVEKLGLHWSPEQIVGRLKKDFPRSKAMRVCVETVYSWVYRDASEGGVLYGFLRRGRKKRRKHNALAALRTHIKDRVSIHDRPEHVEKRNRFGDWEGDTVMGARGRGAVLTLVERKSRYLLAKRLADKTANGLSKVASKAFSSQPQAWCKTLTLDNGSEFAHFKAIEQTSKLKVYFADPYAARQRGTNENTNGLLRQYFPKGCDFLTVSESKLEKAVNAINNRPRKCLEYRTPNEVRQKSIGALRTRI